MAREVQDHYFRLAKQEGYRSRAAYKLMEIDDRKKILRIGDMVLDCGAAPGSWLQVAAQRVGPRGLVVGVDLQPIASGLGPNVRGVQGDLTTMAPEEILKLFDGTAGSSSPRFDVILSDMAPNTTGDRIIDHFGSSRLCEAVLDRCAALLRPGGHAVLKVLEGETYPALLARSQRVFEQVKGFKPKASRGESTEIYIVAKGFRAVGEAETPGATGSSQAGPEVPKRKPSAGWTKRG